MSKIGLTFHVQENDFNIECSSPDQTSMLIWLDLNIKSRVDVKRKLELHTEFTVNKMIKHSILLWKSSVYAQKAC